MKQYLEEMMPSLGKGVLGIAGSGVALASTTLDAIYRWLPWGIGIVIAIGTAISVWLDVRRKWRKK